MADRNADAPWKSWTADEWRARAKHAADYLATDPSWKVGPEVVAFYTRMADRLEHAPCPSEPAAPDPSDFSTTPQMAPSPT